MLITGKYHSYCHDKLIQGLDQVSISYLCIMACLLSQCLIKCLLTGQSGSATANYIVRNRRQWALGLELQLHPYDQHRKLAMTSSAADFSLLSDDARWG